MTRKHSRPDHRAFHAATLGELRPIIWSLLSEGVDQASSPFHTPALATVGDGEANVRTVVLRLADEASRRIACHTDWRSPKRAQLQAHNRAHWMVYDRARKLQLRLAGKVSLHHKDALARERWLSSPPQRRMSYATPLAPGVAVQQPIAAFSGPEDGWDNFAVLTCTIDFMDWLYLRASGHRRAILRWQHARWTGEWVMP